MSTLVRCPCFIASKKLLLGERKVSFDIVVVVVVVVVCRVPKYVRGLPAADSALDLGPHPPGAASPVWNRHSRHHQTYLLVAGELYCMIVHITSNFADKFCWVCLTLKWLLQA